MNKLYQTLVIGSWIPYTILILYYFSRTYLYYFLMAVVYAAVSCILLSGRPVLLKPVVEWAYAQHLAELCMIISFIIRSTYNSQIFTLGIFFAIGYICHSKNKIVQKNITETSVHVSLLTLFLTQATGIARAAGIIQIALVVYQPISKNQISENQDDGGRFRHHFHVRILRTYTFFILEWSLTRLDIYALLFILIGSGLFNVYALATIPNTVHNLHKYANVNTLPKSYPIPLDIDDATAHCLVAKELFKDHTL
jgi:hypothetical protein